MFIKNAGGLTSMLSCFIFLLNRPKIWPVCDDKHKINMEQPNMLQLKSWFVCIYYEKSTQKKMLVFFFLILYLIKNIIVIKIIHS